MTTTQSSSRLQSLDAFRGATIAGMILVNNPGAWSNIYPQLRHAEWNGWTFTDFIFPFFLWMVGVAMTFSFARRVEQGGGTSKLIPHILKRSAIIFGLGLFLTGFPFGLILGHQFSLDTWRIPGVLQRIGVCYLLVSLIFLYTKPRGQMIWCAFLLLGYWLLMKLVPVPDWGAGVLSPMGNLAWYIDSNLLSGHTWSGAPVKGFDPEGILSTIPAISTTLLGVLTGHLLRSSISREEKTSWMFVIGNILLLAGVVLDMWFPINKNLWSPSYVVLMGGWASVCLATFYWFIDVRGHSRWATPFVIYGMNAITVYVLAGVFARLLTLIKWARPDGTNITLKGYMYDNWFVPFASPMNASLLFAIAFVLFTFLIAWIMWRRKWFLKV